MTILNKDGSNKLPEVKKEPARLYFCLLAGALILGILLFAFRGGKFAAHAGNDGGAGAVEAAQTVAPYFPTQAPLEPASYPPAQYSGVAPQSGWQPGTQGQSQLYAMPAPGGLRLKTVVSR